MTDCIFCKIVNKEAPAEIVYEDDYAIVFENINPVAPTHLLAIPKKHIASVNQIEEDDAELIGKTLIAARLAAAKKGIRNGYKVAINVEKDGGQEIFHLHFHILGGLKDNKEIKWH